MNVMRICRTRPGARRAVRTWNFAVERPPEADFPCQVDASGVFAAGSVREPVVLLFCHLGDKYVLVTVVVKKEHPYK